MSARTLPERGRLHVFGAEIGHWRQKLPSRFAPKSQYCTLLLSRRRPDLFNAHPPKRSTRVSKTRCVKIYRYRYVVFCSRMMVHTITKDVRPIRLWHHGIKGGRCANAYFARFAGGDSSLDSPARFGADGASGSVAWNEAPTRDPDRVSRELSATELPEPSAGRYCAMRRSLPDASRVFPSCNARTTL